MKTIAVFSITTLMPSLAFAHGAHGVGGDNHLLAHVVIGAMSATAFLGVGIGAWGAARLRRQEQ